MKKLTILSGALLLSLSAFTATAQQLPNVGFDSWKGSCGETTWTSTMYTKAFTRPGDEPTSWCGSSVKPFNTSITSSTRCEKADDNGNTYVKLSNNTVLGNTIPGYMTLAQPWVFVGGTGWANAARYASGGDGGSHKSVAFSYRPDALTFKYKKEGSEISHAIVILWDGTFKSNVPSSCTTGGVQTFGTELEDVDRVVIGRQDDENVTQKGTLVASADYNITTAVSEWTTQIVPLDYKTTETMPTKLNVVLSASDYWTRANLTGSAVLMVDDVDLVYYSTLSSLKVKGADVTLTEGTYTYDMKGKMPTSVDEVVATCKSQFANATVALDATNYKVTITVTNQGGKDTDGETSHTYTLQYTAPTVKSYTGLLNVDMENEDLFCNSSKTVQISYYNDNTCDFVLPDFSFSGIALGDITVPDVKVTTDASGNMTFSDGNVEAMSLAEGQIYAHVVLSNGTISADGKINMPITVGWMMGYPNDKTEIPINVAFTSEEKVYYAESGYDYAVKDSDYKNPQYEHEYGTFKSVKYGPDEDGEFTYTITLEQQQGNIIVSGLTKDDNDQYSGTDANATWAGETTSVTVSGGKNADGSYELKFTRTAEDGTQYDCVYTTNNVSSSVESLNGAAVAVAGTTGAIEVYNCNGHVAVYTVDGRKVADQTANGNATIPAAAGIYIVRAADKTAKVIVK